MLLIACLGTRWLLNQVLLPKRLTRGCIACLPARGKLTGSYRPTAVLKSLLPHLPQAGWTFRTTHWCAACGEALASTTEVSPLSAVSYMIYAARPQCLKGGCQLVHSKWPAGAN